MSGEGIAAVCFDHRHERSGIMTAATVARGNTASAPFSPASGSGLADDTFGQEDLTVA